MHRLVTYSVPLPGALTYIFTCRIDLDDDDSRNGIPMADLLYTTSDSEASDSRDRMFALVGISDDFDSTLIDYSKKLAAIQREIGLQLVGQRKTRGPLLFHFVNSDGHSNDFPSWIPDWVGTQRATKLFADTNMEFNGKHVIDTDNVSKPFLYFARDLI